MLTRCKNWSQQRRLILYPGRETWSIARYSRDS